MLDHMLLATRESKFAPVVIALMARLLAGVLAGAQRLRRVPDEDQGDWPQWCRHQLRPDLRLRRAIHATVPLVVWTWPGVEECRVGVVRREGLGSDDGLMEVRRGMARRAAWNGEQCGEMCVWMSMLFDIGPAQDRHRLVQPPCFEVAVVYSSTMRLVSEWLDGGRVVWC